MLVLNNPNNPTGKLFTRAELEQIAQFAAEKDLIVVADEVGFGFYWLVRIEFSWETPFEISWILSCFIGLRF